MEDSTFTILGNALYSQAEKHAEYGGVYPSLAKREHQANLVPLATEALQQAGFLIAKSLGLPSYGNTEAIDALRDEGFKNSVTEFLETYGKPDIEYIAVTKGPGLEPALWTGITFAQALGAAWSVPVIGIDHMEGHIVSALLKGVSDKEYRLTPARLPLVALLISGGHTDLVLMNEWFSYEHVGSTKDDAIGEAFDKVARLLDLAYPGGPKIAEFAAKSREKGGNTIVFPRPLANDTTCDFSFSGLKTAVLYKLKSMEKLSESDKEHIAGAFEDAARDVIVLKTRRALEERHPLSLVVGGGVSANKEIQRALTEMVQKEFPNIVLSYPPASLTGDNAIMIGAAAYLRNSGGMPADTELFAQGNLRLK